MKLSSKERHVVNSATVTDITRLDFQMVWSWDVCRRVGQSDILSSKLTEGKKLAELILGNRELIRALPCPKHN